MAGYRRSGWAFRRVVLVAAAVAVALSSVQPTASAVAKKGACDDRIKLSFHPDRLPTVLLVKPFAAGQPVALANSPTTPPPPTAPVDMCLVKLLVGPGNPGPAGVPSTSPGIGIEVWLPTKANWNHIIRSYGSGGWAGGYHTDVTRIGGTGAGNVFHLAAVGTGYVVSTSGHGHDGSNANGGNPSFAMNPDGSINTVLWHDFAERSMHELAVKTKALVKSFYGKPQRHAYWDGFSTGGRQGYKIAQRYPDDYDGILAGAPAFNWTRFITAELGTAPNRIDLASANGSVTTPICSYPKLASYNGTRPGHRHFLLHLCLRGVQAQSDRKWRRRQRWPTGGGAVAGGPGWGPGR
jgi:feruloyl esterase